MYTNSLNDKSYDSLDTLYRDLSLEFPLHWYPGALGFVRILKSGKIIGYLSACWLNMNLHSVILYTNKNGILKADLISSYQLSLF